MLLHARVELLLPQSAVQPEAPDSDQAPRARDEEGEPRARAPGRAGRGFDRQSIGQSPAGAMHRAGVPKILIISSDTGGGHRSAAAAIVAGGQKFWEGDSHAVRVVRAVEESHHLSARMVAFYNWVLRNRQPWMKYVYWLGNRLLP